LVSRWVDAVNNWGKLGRWDYKVVKDLTKIEEVLNEAVSGAGPLKG
jgi:hypothetical protein